MIGAYIFVGALQSVPQDIPEVLIHATSTVLLLILVLAVISAVIGAVLNLLEVIVYAAVAIGGTAVLFYLFDFVSINNGAKAIEALLSLV